MKPQTIHDKGIHSRFYEVTHRLKNVLKACAIGTGLVLAPLPALALPSFFVQQNLVTSNQAVLTGLGYGAAAHVDTSLLNPWGISHSATSPFWVMVTMTIITIVISFLPLVNNLTHPFQIFATFMHEISHAIATVITGGSIASHSLTVRWDGSGEVSHLGGWDFIIGSAGYVGSTLFGCLMMMLAKSRKLAKPPSLVPTQTIPFWSTKVART